MKKLLEVALSFEGKDLGKLMVLQDGPACCVALTPGEDGELKTEVLHQQSSEEKAFNAGVAAAKGLLESLRRSRIEHN